MNTERISPRAPLSRNRWLEDLGFGSTLAGMAVAALVVVGAPVFEPGGYAANWAESCISLVVNVWPAAGAAIGLVG